MNNRQVIAVILFILGLIFVSNTIVGAFEIILGIHYGANIPKTTFPKTLVYSMLAYLCFMHAWIRRK